MLIWSRRRGCPLDASGPACASWDGRTGESPAVPPVHELTLGQLAVLGPVLAEAFLGSGEGDAKDNHLRRVARRALGSRKSRVRHVSHHGWICSLALSPSRPLALPLALACPSRALLCSLSLDLSVSARPSLDLSDLARPSRALPCSHSLDLGLRRSRRRGAVAGGSQKAVRKHGGMQHLKGSTSGPCAPASCTSARDPRSPRFALKGCDFKVREETHRMNTKRVRAAALAS